MDTKTEYSIIRRFNELKHTAKAQGYMMLCAADHIELLDKNDQCVAYGSMCYISGYLFCKSQSSWLKDESATTGKSKR